MKTFKITNRAWGNETTVKAATPEKAIEKHLRKLDVNPRRVTGDFGKSGIFQGYRRVDANCSISVGPSFHVIEVSL